jgi:hypothetical protein
VHAAERRLDLIVGSNTVTRLTEANDQTVVVLRVTIDVDHTAEYGSEVVGVAGGQPRLGFSVILILSANNLLNSSSFWPKSFSALWRIFLPLRGEGSIRMLPTEAEGGAD